MAKLSLVKGTTSHRSYLFIQDSSVTTGSGKTGLAYNTASLSAYYVQPGGSATAITLATQTATGAYSSGGFVEVDATNLPGVYRLDIPNAALTGANSVVVMLKGAANMAPVVLEIELTGVDNQNATSFGLANLDAAVSSRSTYAGGAVASVTGNVGGNVAGSVGSVATGGIVAASFAAGAIDAAAIATDAIGSAELAASAVAEIQSGLMLAASYTAPPSAAENATAVRSELTTELGRLDVAVSTRSSAATQSSSATSIAAIKARTDLIPDAPAATGDVPTAAANAAALLDSSGAIESGVTPRGALRLMLAALAGKVSGAGGSTVTIRNVGDSKTRITATVDSDGNRSAVSTDAS